MGQEEADQRRKERIQRRIERLQSQIKEIDSSDQTRTVVEEIK